MQLIADDDAVYLLEFEDYRGLQREIDRICLKTNASLEQGETKQSLSLKSELELYFKGQLSVFKTPLYLTGTDFQKQVWNELKNIPFGEVRSYLNIASFIERPKAFRAVAQANGANQIAIVIPCHRVINADGKLGGYAGGISRKKWLIDIEKNIKIHHMDNEI